MPTTLKGSCLCGSVQYEMAGEAQRFYHCHCQRCRKATGTGHGSLILVTPATSITWQFRAAVTAPAKASEGSISPNQTTPGLIIDPQTGQCGMWSNPSSGVARVSGHRG